MSGMVAQGLKHRRRSIGAVVALLFTSVSMVGCFGRAQLPLAASTGANPQLPAPKQSLIPTVDIAPAIGWGRDEAPTPASGARVQAFARDLDHPRWLHVLPNGDVLVAESNAPERSRDSRGLRDWIMKLVMKRAGAGGKSADRITLLRDGDGDGVAEFRSLFLPQLNSPFGMALIGEWLYVANTDAVWRFEYRPGATQSAHPGTKIVDLPAGEINHHWTKNLIASPDGQRLYVTVGSNSNVAENGMQAERGRAAIWEIDLTSRKHRLFATGLRNPNGMAWEPSTCTLWTVVNERDELGSDLVPDYLTSVVDGGFYGWPYSYFGDHVDPRVQPARPDLVASALVPDYAVGTHTAPLGLAYAAGNAVLPSLGTGMFIAQHGSWNRRPRSGYRVIHVPFDNGRPSGEPRELLAGFVNADGNAHGRPVGVALDRRGALLVADDVGNAIWRVVAEPSLETGSEQLPSDSDLPSAMCTPPTTNER